MALLANGQSHVQSRAYENNPEGSIYSVPRKVLAYAHDGDIETALAILDEWKDALSVDDVNLLLAYAATGDREKATEYARRIDQRLQGALGISHAVWLCMCGAPFDLDAAPNFKRRIEEAGFTWPPPSPIKYPAKDW